MRTTLAILVTLLSFAAACDRKPDAAAAPTTTLNVFAAASLTESFREIGPKFEAAHPGAKVVFNFGGSQQLRGQMENGAPADVFASANAKEMDAAVKANLIAPDASRTFVRNRLVVIYPKSNPGKIATLADLGRPGVKVDVADPAVPVGAYTVKMLDAMARDAAFGGEFKANVLANVVSREENVKAVVTKVRLGEVDAGVVYVTDVVGDAANDLGKLDVPDAFNQVADYPIAPTAKAKQPELAKQFADFVLSPDGQAVMAKYGFVPAAKP